MSSDCLQGMLLSGGCSLQKPPNGAVLSPWVRVKFTMGNVEMTVGNKSCYQNKHHAVIKDFMFGHATGLDCSITIVDEQGSSFVKFMEDLNKQAHCTKKDATPMEVDFGWIVSNCPGGDTIIKNPETFYVMPEQVECNFTGGKFMFLVTGIDVGAKMFQFKHDQIYGDDKNKMHLTEAITKLLTEGYPSVSSVKFQRYNAGNTIEPIKFKENGVKGRYDVYHGQSIDKINICMMWFKDNISDRDKGIFPTYNSLVKGGEIIFWEDFKPNCGEAKDFDANCYGTFIVNGGKESNVLEFNPKMQWNFFGLQSSGGNAGAGQPLANQDGGKQQGRFGCPTLSKIVSKDAGATSSIPVSASTYNVWMAFAAEIARIGQDKQQKFNLAFHDSIRADLVIVGDPLILDPSRAINALNVKVVFLNPYYIFEGDGCGDWLAAPMCNDVLTNKGWIIQSCTHRISEGKFTTTLGLMLPAPGIDIDVGEPLGGAGSGGWVPPAGC